MNKIEALENRRLFAVDPYFALTSKGTLIVSGTAANEDIAVDLARGDRQIRVMVAVNSDEPGVFTTYHQIHIHFPAVNRLRSSSTFHGNRADQMRHVNFATSAASYFLRSAWRTFAWLRSFSSALIRS